MQTVLTEIKEVFVGLAGGLMSALNSASDM